MKVDLMNYGEFVKRYKLGHDVTRLKVVMGEDYGDIANRYKISKARARQLCADFMFNLVLLYSQHLEGKIDGFQDTFGELSDFYYDYPSLIAYLESEYNEILKSFRNGLPPVLPIKFIPYRKLSRRQLSNLEKKIIYAKDIEKLTYEKIGKKFNITRGKAYRIYDYYYHRLAWSAESEGKCLLRCDEIAVPEDWKSVVRNRKSPVSLLHASLLA